jgi:hypothetical protein
MQCIQDRLTGGSVAPEDDKEDVITQVLVNTFSKTGGRNLFIEWALRYAERTMSEAGDIWKAYKPDKKKDRVTLDTLIDLARPFDDDQLLPEDSYAIWKINHERNCFKIMDTFYLWRNYELHAKTFNQIRITFMDQEDHMKRWVTDPKIRQYDSLNFFPPPLVCPDNVFNTWDLISKCEFQEVDQDVDITPFYTLFRKLTFCGDDNSGYEYLLKYVAHLLKYPAIKPEVALFFTSAQGSGKDTFYAILEKLIGSDLTSLNSQPANVFGKYNLTARMNKLLVVLQEAEDLRKYSEEIKNVITCRSAPLANKGVNAHVYNDYTRLMIFSNNQNILKIDPDDRRFVIYHCYNFHLQPDPQLFRDVYALLNNDNAIKKLRNELLELNVPENYNFKNNRPMTEIYQDLKEINTPLIIKWAWSFANMIDDKTEVHTGSGLTAHYNIWLTEHKYDFKPVNTASWGLTWKKYFCINNNWVNGITKNRNAAGMTFTIGGKELREFIEERYNYSDA